MSVKQALVRSAVSQFSSPRGLGGSLAGWVMAHRASNVQRNEWIVEQLALRPGDHVLEVGFGPGIAIAALARTAHEGRVHGVDSSPVMLRQASRRNADAIRRGVVQLKLAAVDQLPHYREPFDAIMAVNSLQFWPEPDVRLEELRARMRPGGRLAIGLQPRCPGATAETARHAAHTIDGQLAGAGFTELRVETLDLDPPVVCVLGTNP
jgi:ubiquinone/menaquinone biosynthesis C-methylase UbiE